MKYNNKDCQIALTLKICIIDKPIRWQPLQPWWASGCRYPWFHFLCFEIQEDRPTCIWITISRDLHVKSLKACLWKQQVQIHTVKCTHTDMASFPILFFFLFFDVWISTSTVILGQQKKRLFLDSFSQRGSSSDIYETSSYSSAGPHGTYMIKLWKNCRLLVKTELWALASLGSFLSIAPHLESLLEPAGVSRVANRKRERIPSQSRIWKPCLESGDWRRSQLLGFPSSHHCHFHLQFHLHFPLPPPYFSMLKMPFPSTPAQSPSSSSSSLYKPKAISFSPCLSVCTHSWSRSKARTNNHPKNVPKESIPHKSNLGM